MIIFFRLPPPNVFVGGPVRVSLGFPPFEGLKAVSSVERLKACGNDRLSETNRPVVGMHFGHEAFVTADRFQWTGGLGRLASMP